MYKSRKNYRIIFFLILVLILNTVCCFQMVSAKSKRHLNKTSISLEVNQKYKLRLSNAKAKDIQWTSSNPKVVSVKNGMLYARKTGTCKITATYKNKKYRCSVRVIEGSQEEGKVSLTVKEFDKSLQVLTLCIKNNSRITANVGEAFALHILQDNQWVPVDFLEGTAFRCIAMVLQPKESAEISINLGEYFHELETGQYKISYDLGDRGMLSAEFSLR